MIGAKRFVLHFDRDSDVMVKGRSKASTEDNPAEIDKLESWHVCCTVWERRQRDEAERQKADAKMANRMKREGLVSTSNEARIPGTDRLISREIWFPYGIVRDAVIMSQENSGIGTIGGSCRSVAEQFRMLERMY